MLSCWRVQPNNGKDEIHTEIAKVPAAQRLKTLNTDVQDVASVLRIPLAEAELVAKELEREGYISVVGLGGNIEPTDAGRQIAGNANWD